MAKQALMVQFVEDASPFDLNGRPSTIAFDACILFVLDHGRKAREVDHLAIIDHDERLHPRF